MCVSAQRADFSATSLYLGKKMYKGEEIFILGYQNTVQNLYDGPNAMIIHLPTNEFSQENLLDMRNSRSIFNDMKRTVFGEERTRFLDIGKSISVGYDIIEHDIYSIIVAKNPFVLEEAIQSIEERKRITLNQELLHFYQNQKFYSKCIITLWCFDTRDAKEAAPVFLWYKSLYPHMFMLPAIDAHTGYAPLLNSYVDTNHHVYLGSDYRHNWAWEEFRQKRNYDTSIQNFLPDFIVGKRFFNPMRNGDFIASEIEIEHSNIEALKRYVP